MNKDKMALHLIVQRYVDMWEKFCRFHTELYDLTCEEYVHLLSSDIDRLEQTVENKNQHLELIKQLDENRISLITQLSEYTDKRVEKVKDLVTFLNKNEFESQATTLNKLNALLIDIIEKIQAQNKKNQIFLNKAIISLKDLKRSFAGGPNYTTYGSNGVAKNI
ncbi:MAG: flagellar protein FlgN [Bacteriovoracaceae bacterium]|jgi:flagellar biosynthesis/type III secretory pathway chaperone|nr:flagellar protein FlgN [Bacteriovoracaceae bacterium]